METNNLAFRILILLCLTTSLFNCSGSSTSKNEGRDTNIFVAKESLFLTGKDDTTFKKYRKIIPDSLLPDHLEKDTLELTLDYIVWGCPCAPWIESAKRQWCNKNNQSYNKYVIFLEATDTTNRIDLGKFNAAGEYQAVVKGVFYKEKRFPRHIIQNWGFGYMFPAKVFRYFEWEIKQGESLERKVDTKNKL